MESSLQVDTALAMGQLASLRPVVLNGRNPAVGSSIEDIWDGGGLYPFLSVAATLEILSSSASDASAGVGARQVLVDGIDSAGAEKTALVTLNGTTPVSAGDFLSVNRVVVTSSGSSGFNVGTITVRTVVGTVTQALVLPERSTSQMFLYTVPSGYSFIIGTFFFSSALASGAVSGGNATQITLYTMGPTGSTWVARAEFSSNDFVSTTELRPAPNSLALPAGTRIRFAAACTTASMIVTGGMRALIAKTGVAFAPRFAAWTGA